MGAEKGGRRDFLKKIPLFGAGLALGLSALAETDETPKARKIAGWDVKPLTICNYGGGICNQGVVACNIGDCNDGSITCNTGE
ncbi:hypothetical protein J7M22_03750 [Candidatus Poribacteria bacterium]|nr:hypothetical protein [Candidatus Poribacteria bacterium]